MNGHRKILFIINKFAGTRFTPLIAEQIAAAGEKYNAHCMTEFTQAPGHATELAASANRDAVDAVVAVGGDGTINETARGLLISKIPMGIIPRGSGNGLARHLGISISVDQALQNIFEGEPLPMDTFTLNGKLSLNVSGVGFDGHIANLFGGKTRRGLAGYATLTMSEYLRFGEFNATVTAGNAQWKTRSFVLAIANSSQYGNNAYIAPAASVTDGMLNLAILRKVPAYRLDFVYSFFNRTIDQSEYCEVRPLESFRIETETDIPFHVDGEPCGTARSFDIAINPAALPVIAPKKTYS